MKLKYSLSKVDGNALAIVGYVCDCMKKEKKSKDEIQNFKEEAKKSDYEHLLNVSIRMIDELNKK